jgi:hypothetical protein
MTAACASQVKSSQVNPPVQKNVLELVKKHQLRSALSRALHCCDRYKAKPRSCTVLFANSFVRGRARAGVGVCVCVCVCVCVVVVVVVVVGE